MPYAANGKVSTSPIAGGIEISEQQYRDAIEGMLRGEMVSIENGFSVAPVPEPEIPEQPQPEPQPPAYPRFSALEMLDLFTEAEQLAVVQATMADAAVKLWYDRMIAATFVTYEDPRTDGGLQALVTAGLITAERKAEIVAAMQPTTP